MKIMMLGAPGAGKGTQAEKISAKYGIPAISTGEIFRKNIKEGTPLGVQVKEIIESGALVPDELVNALVLDRIAKPDCEKGYILDGYPRTIGQAKAFIAEMEKQGGLPDFALDIIVADEVIVDRMSGRRMCSGCGETYHTSYKPPKTPDVCDLCGGTLILRKDDAPDVVRNRLSVYHGQNDPMVELYKELGIYREFDGTKEISEVFGDICEVLDAKAE